MSPEKQRIAIAEACGWTLRDTSNYNPPCVLWDHPDEMLGALEDDLPDYLNDLNAMHEAEKVLNRLQILRYQEQLYLVATARPDFDGGFASWHYIHATAAQRAEAFLSAVGKWCQVSSEAPHVKAHDA